MMQKKSTTAFAFIFLLIIVGGLVAYKASASLAVIEKVNASGGFTARPGVIPSVGVGSQAFWQYTINYFGTVWIALVFGILISGAVRAFVSPKILAASFGRGAFRPQLVASLAGAPLMLCSCCVAPVFKSVYERSRQLSASLSLMLAAPALNPAAITLTFLLFPARISAARLITSIGAVFLTGLFADRILRKTTEVCEIDEIDEPTDENFLLAFARSTVKVALQTVPVIIIGVAISMLIAGILPQLNLSSGNMTIIAVALVATVAVPLALPTFFEIPLALALLAAGMPPGAALAMLVAGPAINLPSLFTIARSTNWKTAAMVAVMVWLFAFIGGLIVTFI